MNTPAHLLIGAAAFGRRNTQLAGAALLGALLPDASLYVMAGVSLFLLEIPPKVVFDELYFSDAWQTVFAIDNSIPFWALGLCVAFWRRSSVFMAFTAAGLLHLGLDFALHNDDGRPHFYPLSNWVFESPISYWDSQHHAAWVAPIEAVACFTAAIILWKGPYGLRWQLLWLVLLAAEIWVVRQWLLFF